MSAPADLSAPIFLSVAAPAYNEAAGIEAVVRDWHEFLAAQKSLAEFEIVICDDGSTDATGDILDRLTLSCPGLRVLHFEKNQGAAAALNAAIAATKGDWVLLLDSDGQFPIQALPDMLAALHQSGGRAAIGLRQKRTAPLPSSAAGPAALPAIWYMAARCATSIPPLNWCGARPYAGWDWKPKA